MAAASSTPHASGKFIIPAPHSAPTMNSSESPGKNGITTSPVSTNTMANSSAYTHMP